MSQIAVDMETLHRDQSRIRFNQMCEAFFRKWAPEDNRDRDLFSADLMTLVRQIHIDTQEPVQKTLTAILQALPPNPLFGSVTVKEPLK